MIRTQISLEAAMYRRAQAEARRLGISLAELFRRSLARSLGDEPGGRQKKPWMRFSGSISGGAADGSDNARIDADLYGPPRAR